MWSSQAKPCAGLAAARKAPFIPCGLHQYATIPILGAASPGRVGLHRFCPRRPLLQPTDVHTTPQHTAVASVEEEEDQVEKVVASATQDALNLNQAGTETRCPGTPDWTSPHEHSSFSSVEGSQWSNSAGLQTPSGQSESGVQGVDSVGSLLSGNGGGQHTLVSHTNGSNSASQAVTEQPVTADATLAELDTRVQEALLKTLDSASSTSSMDDQDDMRTAVIAEPERPQPAKPAIGLKLKEAAICAAVGLTIRFIVPIPTGVTPQAWTLLSVFCSTIAGLILEPMPVSAWSLTMLTTLLVTKASTFQTAMSGLTNEAIWLITFAFFFAKAFEKTGLGERVANIFVSAVGHSTLGVAYSLALAETLMAPAMPSCTARAGGIFMPVIKFLAKSSGSEPRSGRRKMGAFLVHSQMQVSSNIAALFMTGAAQNLLAINIARSMGVVIPDVWATWALGACLPGIISVCTIPLAIYYLSPPELRSTPNAPAEAKQRLAGMGSLSRDEVITLITLAGAVVLWMLGDHIGCSAVLGAMVALSSLLLTGVLTWRDCLDYTPAWDTLVWFSVLMSLCSALADCGLVGRMAETVGGALSQAKLPWLASFGLLHAVFFWTHYVFASQVGHVGALYGAFLAMMLAAGVPTTLAAMTLGYSANLFGSLTHYASGPAAVFHGSGYTRLEEVMQVGVIMALRSWLVWGVVGMAWWRFLGWCSGRFLVHAVQGDQPKPKAKGAPSGHLGICSGCCWVIVVLHICVVLVETSS